MSDAAKQPGRQPGRQPEHGLPLPALHYTAQPTMADQVFNALQQSILSLELPPGTRISESEVAGRMGVSRQPVREAFRRLGRQGFLQIRPQSGTTVSLISEEAVLRARFIRTALEVQTCRTACETITPVGLAALKSLLEQQKAAVLAQDRSRFHALDDRFHREICVQAGVGYVWDLIHDSKAHMDRIRMLTLSTSTQKKALREHTQLFRAIATDRPDLAAATVTAHLARIQVQIDEIKARDHSWFTDSAH